MEHDVVEAYRINTINGYQYEYECRCGFAETFLVEGDENPSDQRDDFLQHAAEGAHDRLVAARG